MENICIVTLMGKYNYGNRLQNLALQHYLEKLGCTVYTYENAPYTAVLKSKVKNLYSLCYKRFGIPRKSNSNLLLREYKFHLFNKKYIHIKKIRSLESYKCFVGSDQVWAPAVISDAPELLLKGIMCVKKFSFSASLGENEIPAQLKSVYFECLSEFDGISIREKKGVALVKDLGISGVRWTLDPTLLLSKDEWDQYIEAVPELVGRKYIVLYFLNRAADQVYDSALQLSKDTGAEIIDLMENHSKQWYTKDPSEFLWIVKNAICVLTDSFHGTIFSWIYKTPFFIFTRNSKVDMSSRLESLLEILGLKERLDMPCNLNNLNNDWTSTDSYESMKNESEQYIFECLRS